MGLDVANLLLKISGDPDEAKTALTEVAAELKKFGDEEATAKVGIKGFDEAKAKLDDLDKSLTVIGNRDVTAKVKVNIDDAKAKLKKLRDELSLTAAGGAGSKSTPEIFGDIDKLGAEVESKLHSRFEGISRDSHNFARNLFKDFGGTIKSAFSAGLSAIGSGVGNAAEAAPAALGSAAKGIVSLASGAASAIGPLGAVLAIFVALTPAILALVASLAGAVAGLGVLAISFAGVLAPALLLGVAAIKELTQAWQAVSKQQEQAKQSAQAVAQAQQGVHAATLTLSDAQHNLKTQTTEAYTAWKQQIEAVKEDLLGVKSAQLGVESSQLSYKEALQSLKEFRASVGLEGGQFDDLFKKFTNVDFDPSKILSSLKNAGGGELGHKQDLELEQLILNIKQAKLGEAQAQQSLHTSNEKLDKDRQLENRYIKEGIKAYPAYLSALKEVRSAQEGLANSEQTLVKAQEAQSKPLEKITKEQLTLGTQLHTFVADLKALFGPATSEIFKGLEVGLKDVLSLLKDNQLRAAFKALGATIGQVFVTLGKTLSSPEMRKGLTELVRGSSQLVKTLGSSLLVSFIRLFTHLALAVMPAMLKIVERVAVAFKHLADGDSTDALREKTKHIIKEFEEWVKLIKALAALLKAFFHDASGDGDSLARSITKVLEKWTAFLNTKAGQQEVKSFLKDSIKFGGELVTVLEDIFKVVEAITEAAQAANEVFSELGEGIGAVTGGGKSKGEKVLEKSIVTSLPVVGPALGAILKKEGGPVGSGYGGGDKVPILAENGEFVLRKEVVKNVGRASLERLNSTGSIHGGGGGNHVTVEKVVLPVTPGSNTIDPTIAAAKLGKELSKRGLGS